MVRELIPWRRKRDQSRLSRVEREEDNPFLELHREINDVFKDFFGRFEDSLELPGTGWLTGSTSASSVRVDVSESENEVQITADVPGMEEKDIDVELNNNLLTIKGERRNEREEKKRDYHISERSYGMIHRVIPLPGEIDESKAKARFKNGVLTVSIPKTPEAKSRRKQIPISTE